MAARDRQLPRPTTAGQRRRSLQERRLADQLRQNLLRRKMQSRARGGEASEDRAPTARDRPNSENDGELE
jgi:hypothetical protein